MFNFASRKIPPRVEISPEVQILLEDVRKAGFDRVADRLDATWGSATCENYLQQLVANFKRDQRNGFPREAFTPILRLANLHAAIDGPPSDLRGQTFTFG